MKHASHDVETLLSDTARILAVGATRDLQETDNPEVRWGDWAGQGVRVPTKDGQEIVIALDREGDDRPVVTAAPGTRVITSVAAETDIVAQVTRAGVRLVTVLHGPGAPSELRFRLSLPDGLVLERMPSGGYDIVHLQYGASVGRLFAPSARDSMYRPVPAEYRSESSTSGDCTVIMAVQHQDAFYPVVTDPLYERL